MIKSTDFVASAAQFMGRSYKEMDCQQLIESMLASCGYKMDWRGSNHMYRDMAWLGTVETAMNFFDGRIPPGALLFIWSNDGGEIARGYTDGLGNASHVGVYTGTGKGAVHSSQSKGCVCESEFKGKSINGGWNYVGLLKMVDYGPEAQKVIDDEAYDKEDHRVLRNGKVVAASGNTVNLRSAPNKSSNVIRQVKVGTELYVVESVDNEWYRVECGPTKGFMMKEFVEIIPEAGDDIPAVVGDYDKRIAALEERLTRLENEWEHKMGWG